MTKQHLRDSYELLFDSASGDIEAYKELFERYGEKLYNFVYYLTYSREESEDITSDTFIKVFEALQGRDVTSFNFQAYLYKTAKNLSLKAIARRKREGLTLEEAEDFADSSIFADPERAALLSDQRSKVKDASGQLTEDQQAALLLKELEGFPYDTIAEVLDSNPNAVGALLSRARLKFREAYRMTHAQTEGIPDTCAKITPLLSAYIDGEASPEQKEMVEAHLSSCPICNANLESMQDASITYRGLVPILPLATFKVWSAASDVLVAGKAATAVATGATAGATAATGATTTGLLATIGSTLAYKVAAILVAVMVAAGMGVGGYFAVIRVVYAKKQVPSVTGLKEQEATQKVEAAGLKCTCKYPNSYKTGTEVVTEQSIKPGTRVDEGTLVSLTMQDKEMEAERESLLPPTPHYSTPEERQNFVSGAPWDVSVNPGEIKRRQKCLLTATFARVVPYGGHELWFLVESPSGKKYGKLVRTFPGGSGDLQDPGGPYQATFPAGFPDGNTDEAGRYRVFFIDTMKDPGTGQYPLQINNGCSEFDVLGAKGQKPQESDEQILTRLALTEVHNEQPDIPVEIKWIKIVDGWANVVMAPREGGDWGSFYYKKVSGQWTVIAKAWGGEIYKGSIPPDAPTKELDQAPAGF